MPNSDYDQAKDLLKGARERLQKLAIYISGGVQDLRKVVTSVDWNENATDYAGVELSFMRNLSNESVEGLQGAKAKYQQANWLMEGNVRQLEVEQTDLDQEYRRLDGEIVDLNGELKALDKGYQALAAEWRTQGYGGTAGVATYCGILDLVLTFGKIVLEVIC